MLYRILAVCVVSVAVAGPGTTRADDEKKTDRDTKVPAGTEISLTPVEVTTAEKPDDEGRFEVTVKPAKEARKVKMPEEAWVLGFTPEAVKGGGVGVAGSVAGTGMKTMRTIPGKGGTKGTWQADPGDVITHVNGYAVNSVEDVLCAASTAKDKDDIQVVIKDVTTGKLTVFYVTATKR